MIRIASVKFGLTELLVEWLPLSQHLLCLLHAFTEAANYCLHIIVNCFIQYVSNWRESAWKQGYGKDNEKESITPPSISANPAWPLIRQTLLSDAFSQQSASFGRHLSSFSSGWMIENWLQSMIWLQASSTGNQHNAAVFICHLPSCLPCIWCSIKTNDLCISLSIKGSPVTRWGTGDCLLQSPVINPSLWSIIIHMARLVPETRI